MKRTLTPAQYVTYAFGGVNALARALTRVCGRKVYPSTVSRWAQNPERENPGEGLIPPEWHRPILRAADEDAIRGVGPEQIILGGTVDDQDHQA